MTKAADIMRMHMAGVLRAYADIAREWRDQNAQLKRDLLELRMLKHRLQAVDAALKTERGDGPLQ